MSRKTVLAFNWSSKSAVANQGMLLASLHAGTEHLQVSFKHQLSLTPLLLAGTAK